MKAAATRVRCATSDTIQCELSLLSKSLAQQAEAGREAQKRFVVAAVTDFHGESCPSRGRGCWPDVISVRTNPNKRSTEGFFGRVKS